MNISIIAKKPFYDKFFLAPCMAGYLRLALVDSLSFDSLTNRGGAINNYDNSNFALSNLISTNTQEVSLHKGLKKTFYHEIKDVHKFGNHITAMLSYSDIIQIGGAAAIQYAGGPAIELE